MMIKNKFISCLVCLFICTGFCITAAKANENRQAIGVITEHSLLEGKNKAVSQLSAALKSKQTNNVIAFPFQMSALWRGNTKDNPLWQVARKRQLEGWVQGLELLNKYIDKDFDFSKYPSTHADPTQIFGKFKGMSNNVVEESQSEEKVRLYHEASKNNIAYAKLYQFNRKVQTAMKNWQLFFLAEVNRSFLAKQLEPSLTKGYKDVLGVIESTAKDVVVKKRLIRLVNKLKTCPYKIVRRELKTGKSLCPKDK